MIKKVVFGLICISCIEVFSQVVNNGDLTILANTQLSIRDDFNNSDQGFFINEGEVLLFGDIDNDGLWSFPNGVNSGTTRLEGNVTQRITGDFPIEVMHVVFNNTALAQNFQLSTEMVIVGQANFISGVVQNKDFGGKVTFERFANQLNASVRSHVEGEVTKKGDTSFEFPLGMSGFYGAIGISNPGNITDAYTVQYFAENSDTLYPHATAAGIFEFIDTTEYWVLQKNTGIPDIEITIRWDINSPTQLFSGTRASIHIARWDTELETWIDEGGVIDEGAQTISSLGPISGEGVFALAKVKEEDTRQVDDFVIYDFVTPNNDGINDVFFIDGIEKFPENSLAIYNRWGSKVYEENGYNNRDVVFSGMATTGTVLINTHRNTLPVGTYFYILKYKNSSTPDSEMISRIGYLYIG